MAGDEGLHGKGERAYLYVISAGEQVHKIGLTRLHPNVRLAALQTGHHTELILVGFVCVLPGTEQAAEKAAHKSLMLHRGKGEWFRVPEQEVIAAVESATGVPLQRPDRHLSLNFNDGITMTGRQLRAARALLDWRAETLAQAAKVGINTIRRAEAEDGPVRMTAGNSHLVRQALEEADVEFIPENGGGAGVRMRQASSGEHRPS